MPASSRIALAAAPQKYRSHAAAIDAFRFYKGTDIRKGADLAGEFFCVLKDNAILCQDFQFHNTEGA